MPTIKHYPVQQNPPSIVCHKFTCHCAVTMHNYVDQSLHYYLHLALKKSRALWWRYFLN